ncbi:MAG TPA: GNAT family N-acetyltransferase [Solirubrobacter sp.]|nr:GNAT family N-acetyltransferase [Solirubrobacter sp.]
MSQAPWPYYARPRLGADDARFTVDAVIDARARLRELGQPETFEWVHETAPSLISAVRALGLDVLEVPLLVLDRSLWRAPEPPAPLRRLQAGDDALAASLAVAEVGFNAPGTRPGPEGPSERDAVPLAAALVEHMGERLATGQSVIVVANTAAGPVATGTLRPVGDVAEIVGVATLPAVRRQGLGSAVTGALVEIALEQGIELVFLSAADDQIARVYERLGFRRAGTACFLR